MALTAGCPRCHREVVLDADGCACPDHGRTEPFWRPAESSYDDFAQHLLAAGSFPTWLPWPLGPGWRVGDFGRVGDGRTHATMVQVTGESHLDGTVDLWVVSEEAGTGLGARCAGLPDLDPGAEIGRTVEGTRVRIGGHPTTMWPVAASTDDAALERAVLVGEAHGRWLWVVVRPAPAVLMLREGWGLTDAAGMGPALVEVPFGWSPPSE